MKFFKTIGVVVLVVMLVGLVLGTACGTQGIQGPKGDTGATGAQGPKGDPGGLAWGSPTSYGPYSFELPSHSTGPGFQSIPSLSPGDRVSFNFTVAGGDVYLWVYDPYSNAILFGNVDYSKSASGIQRMSYGQGAFIAAASGTYKLVFYASGIPSDVSVVTVNYTVYPILS